MLSRSTMSHARHLLQYRCRILMRPRQNTPKKTGQLLKTHERHLNQSKSHRSRVDEGRFPQTFRKHHMRHKLSLDERDLNRNPNPRRTRQQIWGTIGKGCKGCPRLSVRRCSFSNANLSVKQAYCACRRRFEICQPTTTTSKIDVHTKPSH